MFMKHVTPKKIGIFIGCMIAIIAILFAQGIISLGVALPLNIVAIASDILIWIATILTAVSGVQYLMSYWDVIDTNK